MKYKKNVHPFPARMAPEIALKSIKKLPKGAIILDPMTGSGTVLRQAVCNGHKAIGLDMDPLAILMSKVWTQPVNSGVLDKLYKWLISKARKISASKISLPWIDKDKETKDFINYWFATRQKQILRRLAYVIATSRKINAHANEANLLRIALSRLIITKHRGASLAWDVSHSRPHKVKETNEFDVWIEFYRSFKYLKTVLDSQPLTGISKINLGDARKMTSIRSKSIDAVITSPPYLNAIDYLRGHKLSLVWLGYTIKKIRNIRGECIGVEKKMENKNDEARVAIIISNLKNLNGLPARQKNMIERYIADACNLMRETARVLKPNGRAIFVVGNSRLKNVFVENSKIFHEAGKFYGLKLTKQPVTRKLPINCRYLPMPKGNTNALSKRMKTEVILEFACA